MRKKNALHEIKKSPRQMWFSSVASRLFFATALPSSLLIILLGIAAWSGARSAVMESLNTQLRTAVSIGAARLSASRALFLLPGDEKSRTYKRLQKKLLAIQKASGSIRVLLLDNHQKILVDVNGEFAIGSPAPRVSLDKVEIERALTGTASVSTPFTAADGRRFMSAYCQLPADKNAQESPKKNSGLVLAMEAPATTLDLIDDVAVYFSLVVFLGIVFVVLLSYFVAGSITRPLRSLALFAESLGRGALQMPLPVQQGKDEVALLGDTLEKMRQALVERDQEQQMMLAGIAHEIRNPLGGMELFSGLLEEGLVEGSHIWNNEIRLELIVHAGRIRHELVYLKGVVNDFLTFARNLPIARSEVNIADLMREVCQLRNADSTLAQVLIHDIQIQLLSSTSQTNVPDKTAEQEAIFFPMDKRRIKEALLNLLSNAQEASQKQDSVFLSACLFQDKLQFTVEDHGKGMSLDVQKRVFTPFFTTRERGSGLGLPLVKKFAKDHGGDARIESSDTKGTKVWFWIARETSFARLEKGAEFSGRLPEKNSPFPKNTSQQNTASTSNQAEQFENENALEIDNEPLLLGDE